MFNIKKIIVLSYLCLPFSLYSSYEIEWKKFIESPNTNKIFSYLLYSIENDAKLCDWGKPVNQKVIPQQYGQNLYKLISEGNENAFNIGFIIKKCLDGGELEDYIRSMGLFFEKKPLIFLEALHKQKISIDDATRMISVTPYYATDDTKQQTSILEKRLLILKSLFSFKYESERVVIEKILNKRISNLYNFLLLSS